MRQTGQVAGSKVIVDVAGRRLGLSNLDKVLYPQTGTTKGEVIQYYTQVAPVLLPHLTDRPLTRKRWPDGVAADSFFEKNAPRGTPDWVRTVELPSPGSSRGTETVTYVVCDDLPTLVWLANLAVLEFHVPQWRVDGSQPLNPDRLVFDFDPGPPATIVECSQVALLVAEALAHDGLLAHPKTSGSKGMQAYVALDADTPVDEVHGYARRLAERLEKAYPKLIVSRMDKSVRRNKVLIDWSQNSAAKTTVAPYSLRGADAPTVSMPVRWDEVERTATKGDPLRFDLTDALARVEADGDLLTDLLTEAYSLPPPADH
ncbi:MAG TPA: non-homologous end-joining DNA ligase [Jiangellales bacterium]|nr:non-homologous end-joining DNA ligase [Jiangellales bacterium]